MEQMKCRTVSMSPQSHTGETCNHIATPTYLTWFNIREVLVLTLRITGRVVDVYVNGDQVVSYTVSADFSPTKFDMTTQPDRANVEYLSSEMG